METENSKKCKVYFPKSFYGCCLSCDRLAETTRNVKWHSNFKSVSVEGGDRSIPIEEVLIVEGSLENVEDVCNQQR